MKRFRNFISEEEEKEKIPFAFGKETHGSHSYALEPLTDNFVFADMVHGAHAHVNKPKSVTNKKSLPIKENTQSPLPYGHSDNWQKIDSNPHITVPTFTNYGKDEDLLHHLQTMRGDITQHPDFAALHRYTLSSAPLNEHLKESAKAGTPIDPHFTVQYSTRPPYDVDALDRITTHYRMPHSLNVFSGISYDPSKIANQNGMFTTPAYTSTSLSRSIGLNFANQDPDYEASKKGGDPWISNLMHIHMDAGQKHAVIGHESNYPHEREILLPRNSTFQLIHPQPQILKTEPHGRDPAYLHVWHVKPIQQ